MKLVFALSLVAISISTANAFAPSLAFTRKAPQSQRYSSGPEDEEGGLDLNLEEMFDM